MRQLPKAIPELDGGLFVPRPVLELLEAVLLRHEQLLQPDAKMDQTVLFELRTLLRLTGLRLPVPPAPELLELTDPRQDMIGRNLLRQ